MLMTTLKRNPASKSNGSDAVLDRLVHNAHRIEMKGDSMRKKRGTQPSS